MAIKLPHDRYLRFLSLALPKTEDIHRTLNDMGIPVSDKEIDDCGAFLETVVPESIFEQASLKKFSPGFSKWMHSLEIEELWHAEKKYPNRDPHKASLAEYVLGLHGDQILTLTLNSLLIKGMPADAICQALNAKYACRIEASHVDLYRRFFFNPAHMTRASWKSYLDRCNSRQKSVYFIALTESLDDLKTELGLPSKSHSSSMLQHLLSKSFNKAKMYLDIGTAEANREARAWIATVTSLTDKYERYRTGDTEDFANQLELAFEFDEGVFDTPDHQTLESLNQELSKKSESYDKKDGAEKTVEEPPSLPFDS